MGWAGNHFKRPKKKKFAQRGDALRETRKEVGKPWTDEWLETDKMSRAMRGSTITPPTFKQWPVGKGEGGPREPERRSEVQLRNMDPKLKSRQCPRRHWIKSKKRCANKVGVEKVG